MDRLTEEQMWEVIDGEASESVLKYHKILIKEDKAYRCEFEECSKLHTQLLHLDLEVPSMRFTENVLDHVLPKVQEKPDRMPIYFLLIIGSLVLVSIVLSIRLSNLATQPENSINTEGVTTIFSNPIMLTIFLVANALLFLIILDKKILKPFFQKRLRKAK